MSPRRAHVITASNRAAAGVYPDRGGPLIVEWLRERGYQVPEPTVAPDGPPVGEAMRAAVTDGVDVVVTTGGTGISPTDATPEVTRELLDFEIPGLADAIRAAGAPKVPTAVLSRGLAGVAGRTLVVNLPGSTGGTGISPTDATPEVTRELLDYEIPGLADAIRAAGAPTVPTAVLSRGLAGVAGRTLVVNLPGSTGGVRDGLAVLDGVLDHAIDQLRGGDH